jgi:hypothetical protein
MTNTLPRTSQFYACNGGKNFVILFTKGVVGIILQVATAIQFLGSINL